MFVLPAVCISECSTVTAECIQKPEEIQFMLIITKEQALNYCTSFLRIVVITHWNLLFYYSSFDVLQYHEIIKYSIGRKEKSELECSMPIKQEQGWLYFIMGKHFFKQQ